MRADRVRDTLAEATAHIGSTLDLGQTATEAVEAVVPAFADVAAVYVAERLLVSGDPAALARNGQRIVVRRLAGRFAGQARLPAQRTAPPDNGLFPPGELVVFEAGSAADQVMATGKPMLYDKPHDQAIRHIAKLAGGSGPAQEAAQEADRFTSFLAEPLAAHGTTLGCILLGRARSSPAFTRNDATIAAGLVDRAAASIDNARLYSQATQTALALQRGLLLTTLPRPAGLDVAFRYQPTGTYVVGGDWHDIITLPDGRAALIIGDAMGHGPEAATAMVQFRTAAHAFASLGFSPARILRELNQITETITAAPFATCVTTVIDTVSGDCVAARAGHPPPVIAFADGGTRVTRLEPGLPLGVGAERFSENLVRLPPGATLALYTDGLVERRDRAIDDGIGALRTMLGRILSSPRVSLDNACEKVVRELGDHGEDDITLILVRRTA